MSHAQIDLGLAAATIEANVAAIRKRLGPWAAHMAARYNAPVYLLGSTLHNPSPRDCDIRIVIEDHEFGARYGMEMKPCDIPATDERKGRTLKIMFEEEGPTQRWIDDIAKFSGHLSQILKTNVDLQVVPASWWRDRTYPEPVLLAAPSPRWFIYNEHVPDPAIVHAKPAEPATHVDQGEGPEC